MSKSNGSVSVAERRELAKLVKIKFDNEMDIVRQSVEYTEGHVFEKIAKKFKIQAIKKEIDQYQDKIKFLEKKLSELGFETDGNSFKKEWSWSNKVNQSIIPHNTAAGRMYYQLVRQTGKLADMEDQKNKILTDIWLHADRQTIQELVKQNIKKPTTELLEEINA